MYEYLRHLAFLFGRGERKRVHRGQEGTRKATQGETQRIGFGVFLGGGGGYQEGTKVKTATKG